MSNILIRPELTSKELRMQQASLREQKDMLIIEAISRSVGHTDWQYDQISHLMNTRDYPDKSSVFSFRGRDMLLFDPPFIMDGHLVQPAQYLYDKTDFKYMTYEEREDMGYYGMPTHDEPDEDGLTEFDRVRAGILDEDENENDEL